jgi:hypothetical protein
LVVLIPRIRTINVRLSDAEYLELERLCVAKGARSLSDFVRNAVREQVAIANQDSALTSTVNHHDAQVKVLEQKIERLSAEIASLRADSAANNRTNGEQQSTSKPMPSAEQPVVDQQEMFPRETVEPSLTESDSQATGKTKA